MIIKNFLDNDMYKFSMGQFIHKYYPGNIVEYKFKNRGEEFFLDDNDLLDEIFFLRDIKITDEELEFLDGIESSSFFNPNPIKTFSKEYLEFLKNIDFDDIEITVDRDINDKLDVRVIGPWEKAIFFEIPVLAIISEMRSKSIYNSLTNTGRSILTKTDMNTVYDYIQRVNENRSLRYSDFSTRRRMSREWQRRVLVNHKKYLDEQYHLSGTSNLHFARTLNLKPIGTFAHELPMVLSGLFDDPRESYPVLMEKWKEMYGNSLNILLTDTFTTDWLFDNHGKTVVEWEGVRQDSGDPFEFVEKYIDLLNSYGIDGMSRVIVFSNGLSIEKSIDILEYCRGRVWATFGIGTKLSHNTVISPPNIVMKANVVNGKNIVKLSDEEKKHTGYSKEVNKYINLFTTKE